MGLLDLRIDFNGVRNGAKEISACANTMESIFNSVTGSMRTMTSEDAFQGEASEALKAEFEPFRAKFDQYVDAVRRFAALYEGAATTMETSEAELKQKENEFLGGNN